VNVVVSVLEGMLILHTSKYVYYNVSGKRCHYIFASNCQILTDFQYSFIIRLSSKFVVKR